MSILWYAGYFALFTILMLFSLLYRNFVTRRSNAVQLNPHTMLVCSYFLYSISLPVSRLFFGSIGDEFDLIPLRYHLYGFLGIALGAIASLPVTRGQENLRLDATGMAFKRLYGVASMRTGFFTVVLIILTGRYFWLLLAGLNFDIKNVFQPYGYEQWEGLEQSGGLADIFVYFGLYGMLVFGVAWDRHVRRLPGALRSAVYALIVFFIAFYILRGSRNMVTLLALPMIAAIFYKKDIKLVRAMAVGLVIITFFYVLGGIRNIGFSTASRGDYVEIATSIDPLYGEFGTSYSVLNRALGIGVSGDLLLGKSYTIDPVVNMVPRSWWPNRPDNPAIAFSKRYFNTDQLTEGLGFSPVLEAYLNFGEFGIILVFALFYFIVTVLDERHRAGVMRNVMLIAFALPIIINWNRIDMSTAFKMYSGFILMAYMLPKMFIQMNPVRHQT